jgi:hypothetical protein
LSAGNNIVLRGRGGALPGTAAPGYDRGQGACLVFLVELAKLNLVEASDAIG